MYFQEIKQKVFYIHRKINNNFIFIEKDVFSEN